MTIKGRKLRHRRTKRHYRRKTKHHKRRHKKRKTRHHRGGGRPGISPAGGSPAAPFSGRWGGKMAAFPPGPMYKPSQLGKVDALYYGKLDQPLLPDPTNTFGNGVTINHGQFKGGRKSRKGGRKSCKGGRKSRKGGRKSRKGGNPCGSASDSLSCVKCCQQTYGGPCKNRRGNWCSKTCCNSLIRFGGKKSRKGGGEKEICERAIKKLGKELEDIKVKFPVDPVSLGRDRPRNLAESDAYKSAKQTATRFVGDAVIRSTCIDTINEIEEKEDQVVRDAMKAKTKNCRKMHRGNPKAQKACLAKPTGAAAAAAPATSSQALSSVVSKAKQTKNILASKASVFGLAQKAKLTPFANKIKTKLQRGGRKSRKGGRKSRKGGRKSRKGGRGRRRRGGNMSQFLSDNVPGFSDVRDVYWKGGEVLKDGYNTWFGYDKVDNTSAGVQPIGKSKDVVRPETVKVNQKLKTGSLKAKQYSLA